MVTTSIHASDCAVNNMPALPQGPCDCGLELTLDTARHDPITAPRRNKMTHTPTPWELVKSTEHHGPYLVGPGGTTICGFYVISSMGWGPSKSFSFYDASDNAKFVLRAVNAHDALVTLVKQFEKSVEYEIARDRDHEGRQMKSITLRLIQEALALTEER